MNLPRKERATPIFLLKITRKEYIEDIISNRKLFMKNASYFRELERQQNNNVSGDIKEGSSPQCVEDSLLIDGEWIRLDNVSINSNECLFCMYIINADNSNSESDNSITHTLKWETIKQFIGNDSYTNWGIICVQDYMKFTNWFLKEAEKKNLFGACGFVDYDEQAFIPLSTNPHDRKTNIEHYFHKRVKYAYQNEYRLIVQNISDTYVELDIPEELLDVFCIIDIQKNQDIPFRMIWK